MRSTYRRFVKPYPVCYFRRRLLLPPFPASLNQVVLNYRPVKFNSNHAGGPICSSIRKVSRSCWKQLLETSYCACKFSSLAVYLTYLDSTDGVIDLRCRFINQVESFLFCENCCPSYYLSCFVTFFTPRKKTATACAFAKQGRGLIKVNGQPIENIEPECLRLKAFEPVLILGQDKFANLDIRIRVKGGGFTAQIYAIREKYYCVLCQVR